MVGRLEAEVEEGEVTGPEAIQARLVELLAGLAGSEPARLDLTGKPAVIMVVGVNGTGKTTTIGKLAAVLRERFGLTVIVAAADTYRAAAIEQLETWAERAGTEIVKGNPGGDPGAVVFDALAAAEARDADVVIVDTAGRLHTHGNLMEELAKVRRVAGKRLEGAPHETLIVIDATTGQNGLRQARAFADAVERHRGRADEARRHREGRDRARDRRRARDPGEADRRRGGDRGPAPVRRSRVRHRAARRVASGPCSTSSPTASRRRSPTSARAAS